LLLADPCHWDAAVIGLVTLGVGHWMEGNVIEWFLWDNWIRTHETSKVWYVPLEYTHCCRTVEGPSFEGIGQMRRYLKMPPRGQRLIMRPVVVPMFAINHYFVVVFDFKYGRYFTFGRSSTARDLVRHSHIDSNEWDPNGVMWKNVKTLFGWQTDYDHPQKLAVDWDQVWLFPSHFSLIC
jgi:hypothetical protein